MDPIYKRIWTRDENLTHHALNDTGTHGLCYSALLYAAQNNLAEAQTVLGQIDKEQPDHSCSLILEAKALVHYSLREVHAAQDFALRALQDTSQPLFAYSVLGGLAFAERRYPQSIQYYQRVLDDDPENDRILLHVAQAHWRNRNSKEARRYIDMAKPSARKRLYKFFLPFMHAWVRLLWLALVIASFVNLYLFLALYVLATAMRVYLFMRFGYKEGDQIIMYHTVGFQMIHTVFFAIAACGLLDMLFAR